MTDQSFGIIPFRTTQQGIEFLLVHQQKGHWGFPKGHAEQNETPIEAALRECKEETGLASIEGNEEKAFREHYVFVHDGIHVFKTITYFLGRVSKGRISIQKEEIQDYRWASYEEAMQLLSFPEVRGVLKDANPYALKLTK